MDHDVEDFIQHGADLVLTKPLRMNELDAIISHFRIHGFVSKTDSSGRRYLYH